MKKIKASVYNGEGLESRVEEIEIAEPLEGELLVKLVSSGICHTDIWYRDGHAPSKPEYPTVLGHEGAGIVEKVGPGVKEFVPGDHVVMTTLYCGECEFCGGGEEWWCESNSHYIYSGKGFHENYTMFRDGAPVSSWFAQSSWATHAIIHHHAAVKVNKDMDLKVAGPIGCGLRTGAGAVWNYLRPRPSEWVMITGAGAVGFGAQWMASAMGAKTIMCDIVDSRLELAKETGCDVVINSAKCDAAAEVLKITGGRGVSHWVEASGNSQAYLNGLKALCRGGRCAEASVIGPMTFDVGFYGQNNMKTTHQIRMGDVAGKVIIPILCDMYLEGKFPIDKICKFYTLDQVEQAIKDSENGKVIKPVILFKE